jgi:hypothetical protein
MKTVRPTSSYQFQLPDEIRESTDTRVSSFWIEGQSLLLQTSSYQRIEGEQIPAEQRLRERMAKHASDWESLASNLCPDPAVDQAAAEQQADGLVWIHAYFVWTHLTVYATLSGSAESVRDPNSWARTALKTLSVSLQ